MSKAALLRIERCERGLSLDEALAFAAVLHAVPAHMLSPPDDEIVWLTGKEGVDGAGLRNWLLFGDPLLLNVPGQRVRLRLEVTQAVAAHAQAIVDALQGRDEAGYHAAAKALARTAVLYQQEMEQLEVDEVGQEESP